MPLSGSVSRRVKALSSMSTPSAEDATSTCSTEQPVVFKLQLRPLEDTEIFKPSVQLVSREFATRYLESVGVRPSKATVDLVNRNVPLTEAHIKTTLRAKGHVEDEIHISVPPVTHRYRVPVVINPAAVLQLGIGNSVLGARPDGQTDAEVDTSSGTGLLEGSFLGGGRTGDLTTASTTGRAPGGTDFLDMAARYLHPFNLDLNLARQNVSAIHAMSRQQQLSQSSGDVGGRAVLGEDSAVLSGRDSAGVRGSGGGLGQGSSSGVGSGSASGVLGGNSFMTSNSGRGGAGGPLSAHSSYATSSRRSGSWPQSGSGRPVVGQDDGGGGGVGAGVGGGGMHDAARLEVLEELSQPLLVTPEVVLTLQGQLEDALADWHRHQAPEALKGRLTLEEFHRTQEELSSEGLVKLLITLVNFLHEELICGHPSYPAQLAAATRESSRTSGLAGERSSLGHSGGGSGDGAMPTTTGRRSYAGSHTMRGGVQLPAHISIQQMTNLQKYDLGYQAYVRQKLEQRQAQGTTAALTMTGSGGRQLTTPLDTRCSSQPTGLMSSRSERPPTAVTTMSQTASLRPQSQPQSHRMHLSAPSGAFSAETARVSFAVAPLYASVPSSPQTDSRPGSPGPRSGGASSSILGPLNIPGASRSRPTSSLPNPPTSACRIQRSPSPNSVSAAAPEQSNPVLTSPPIPGLPPHIGRALRGSPSFALAAAANTARSIHASLDAADMAALQRERLFALHMDFAARFKALRQKRSGMFFTLPILLLSMRLCVNLLFSTIYALWTRLPEGARVLEQMDAALCALFDPHGYLERLLSVLQSTPSAIEAVTRHPQRRGNERRHFNDTSALLQATLQGAKSPGARKLMTSAANQPQGLSLMRTQLTTEQRATLFQMGLQWMQQPDPVLSQVGEPHAAGRL